MRYGYVFEGGRACAFWDGTVLMYMGTTDI